MMKNMLQICFITFCSLGFYTHANEPTFFWSGYVLGEGIANLSGGLHAGSILNGAAQLVANYNLQERFHQNALVKFGYQIASCTRYQSNYTSAIQSPSAFLAPRGTHLANLSYQYNFSKQNKVIIGVMDMNENFNLIENASTLLNNAFSNTVTLYANSQLATFPFAGLGAMAFLSNNDTTAMFGVFQGNPEHLRTAFYRGYMAIGELDRFFTSSKSDANYSIKLGAWMYQQSNANVAFTLNAQGLYVISQANWTTNDDRKLSAFLNFGYSNQEVKYVPYSIALGGRVENVFFKDIDTLSFGIGKSWVENYASEVAYELAYSALLAKGLWLTPDLQYIVKPSGYLPNAWVAMLRLLYVF